jgi:hypothetical protein
MLSGGLDLGSGTDVMTKNSLKMDGETWMSPTLPQKTRKDGAPAGYDIHFTSRG